MSWRHLRRLLLSLSLLSASIASAQPSGNVYREAGFGRVKLSVRTRSLHEELPAINVTDLLQAAPHRLPMAAGRSGRAADGR